MNSVNSFAQKDTRNWLHMNGSNSRWRIEMGNVTVSDLIKLLDKEGNKRGGATGKERILSIQVNGEFIGYITSAKLDGWGDGLITDVCLEVETE